MHQQSVARVATWSNTLQADRKARLEAAQRKADEAEAARVVQDQEWHAILDQERNEFLERTKMMQTYDTARVRELHSKVVLQDVLAERALQIQYKKERAMKTSEDKSATMQRIKEDIARGEAAEADKREAHHKKVLEIAQAQIQQAKAQKEQAAALAQVCFH